MDVLIIRPPSPVQRASKERSSAEATIFSIYSMYGDDSRENRASRAPSPPLTTRFSKVPAASLTSPDSHQNSFLTANGFDDTELAYLTSEEASKRRTVSTGNGNNVHVPYSSRTSLVSQTTPRPPSSYAASSSPRTASDRIFDDHGTSAGHQSHLSSSSTSSSGNVFDSSNPSNPQKRRDSSSKKSLRSSRSSIEVYPPQPHFTRRSKSQFSIRDLPPLPTSRPSTAKSPSSPLSHPSSLSRLANAATPSPPPVQAQQLIAQKQTASPSKTSLVPSEGEDMDAFHVRSTYAQLEASGVRGDGYEEGVERTRARVRSSQDNTDATILDRSEKKGDLDPRELQVLAGVDRYGFFNLPSHDRLVRLDAAPLHKKLSRFQSTKDGNGAGSRLTFLRSLPPPPRPFHELSRTAKWMRMLKAEIRDVGVNTQVWRIRSSKESKLRERTYKGIPDCWRSVAWDMLICRFASSGPEKSAALANDYREALDKPSSYDIQIDLDVPRTISGHVMFTTRYGAGQRSLFHVLHAFSLRCHTCGYVQGMGPIAATLLNYFEPEGVYASLIRLHDAYSLHSVFSPGFPGMLEAIYVQERITEMFMPDVYAAFKQHMISTTSYATKWYITLFVNSVPFQTQLRFWDAFLLEGYDVFIAIAVAIVWVYRDHITAKSANFESILSLLSSFFVPEDENVLMSWIEKMLSDKKLRSNMRRWREDWKALVRAGKEGSALL